jgi:cob(I)alamin adenosyltransferase
MPTKEQEEPSPLYDYAHCISRAQHQRKFPIFAKMKIYTKQGDSGTTSLFGGKTVPKNSLRIDAYGNIDELNSVIGVARASSPEKQTDDILEMIQHALFNLGADLATEENNAKASAIPRISQSDVTGLEMVIDEIDPLLPPLQQFILPGGANSAAQLHLARTVCRRAERATVALAAKEAINDLDIIYLNRLSDLLFVLARFENHLKRNEEIRWNGGTRKGD